MATWDAPETPSVSVDESSGCLTKSLPERLYVGTLEVYGSFSELRFVERNCRRNMPVVDKKVAI